MQALEPYKLDVQFLMRLSELLQKLEASTAIEKVQAGHKQLLTLYLQPHGSWGVLTAR